MQYSTLKATVHLPHSSHTPGYFFCSFHIDLHSNSTLICHETYGYPRIIFTFNTFLIIIYILNNNTSYFSVYDSWSGYEPHSLSAIIYTVHTYCNAVVTYCFYLSSSIHPCVYIAYLGYIHFAQSILPYLGYFFLSIL